MNTVRKFRFSQAYVPKSKEDIITRIHKFNMNTVTMGFPDLYGKFIGKKFDTDYFVDKALKNGSNVCNYLLSCDMTFNPIDTKNLNSTQAEKGFGDFTMKADWDSVREINYINDTRQLLFFADLYDTQNDKPIQNAPRYLLRKSVEDLKLMGYKIYFECDISFNIFFDRYRKLSENFSNAQTVTEHSNLYNTIYKQNFEEFLNKTKNCLKISNITVDKIMGDRAPGQFRVSLARSDCLEFCDNVTLFKLCIKKLADDNDKTVSFMAKLNEGWLGNTLGLKIIIEDSEGNNILENFNYDNQTKLTKFKNIKGEHAVSGIIYHLQDFMLFYAPTVNSYKRFKENHFDQNWNSLGFMQDDCGVNLIQDKSTPQILFTMTGSDVNPYLSLSSLLTSIKSGLDRKLPLQYSLNKIKNDTLPINLYHAVEKFENNKYMKSILGEDLHRHYLAFYYYEYREFMNQVDEWELNRYLFNI